ncbi:MAG TPA: hypothetical protein VN577_20025 [Terriglobales bacterium]|nr:hypothetical protein [Clostridia bacterium]HWR17128.1 hypothetical protein [Terriglobales bacterium]
MTTQQQFAAKVNELIAQSHQLAPDARKKVLEMLDQARKRILGELVSLNPNSFSAAQLRALKLSIDQEFELFRQQSTAFMTSMQTDASRLGTATIGAPLSAAGLEPFAIGGLSSTHLAIAQGYTADLVTALSKDAAAKVNGAIQRAFLGGQQITDIIEQIGMALNKGSKPSMFDQIGERAITIAQNEILRVHSMAAQAKLQEAKTRHPDLKKKWKHLNAAKLPRITHILADGQVKEVEEAFEIPVKPGAPPELLMFPRDPSGSAENTINCHCLEQPHFDDEALRPTSVHKKVLRDLGISVQVA